MAHVPSSSIATSAAALREYVCGGNGEVLVVGLGISGIEAALALRGFGHRVIAIDDAERDKYLSDSRYGERLRELEAIGVEIFFGEAAPRTAMSLCQFAFAIVSPGVSTKAPSRQALAAHQTPQITEFELGVIIAHLPVIMVTGSNGKSTTVSLISHLLHGCGVPHRLAGNIGDPVMRVAAEIFAMRGESPHLSTRSCEDSGLGHEGDSYESTTSALPRVLVLEASSYQLSESTLFAPECGVFLNLAENHLERHGSMEKYFAAKATPFLRQDQHQWAVYNCDDFWASRLPQLTRASCIPFGSSLLLPGDSSAGDTGMGVAIGSDADPEVTVRTWGMPFDVEVHAGELSLRGRHNLANVAAALGALGGLALGSKGAFSFDGAKLRASLCSFSGIPHRCEVIGTLRDCVWINDSKSTTVASTCAAVEFAAKAFPGRPLVVLVGGVLKEGSWQPFIELFENSPGLLRHVITFGAGGSYLAGLMESNGIPVTKAVTLQGAVTQATTFPGSVVLLSPGGASFDEFKGFDERGDAFREYVRSTAL